MTTYYIVERQREKDGEWVGDGLGMQSPEYASAPSGLMRFWDRRSADKFMEFARHALQRNLRGTEFGRLRVAEVPGG